MDVFRRPPNFSFLVRLSQDERLCGVVNLRERSFNEESVDKKAKVKENIILPDPSSSQYSYKYSNSF